MASGKAGRVLDLDLGNTRIKWRFSTGAAGAVLYTDDRAELLAEAGRGGVSRIRVASVIGAERNAELAHWCRFHWGVTPEFANGTARCAGVTNGYEDPAAIGVDRWLAVLAAYNRFHRACLIVNCGSAATVDMVDSAGLHLGGYIVPGLQLMRRALFQGTHAVKVPAVEWPPALAPGRTTAAAVNNGLPLMLLGLIRQSQRELAQLTGEEPALVLTGGDSEALQRYLEGETALIPGLVLDGLALALP